MQNGTLVLADSVTAVKETAPSPLQAGAPRLAASLSMHNTAVVLFGFTGGPTQSQLTTDPASATTEMFGDPLSTPDSLNAYYQEQTYGQIGFSGTVFGPYDVPGPTGTCSANDFYTWAAQAENATGMNDSAFKHWVFVFPDVPACGWSGLAEIGGPHVWINGDFEVPVIAHELGHNLGISHAGGLSCTASGVAAPMGDICTIDRTHYQLPQYADPFDAMGNWPVLRQMNMEHKQALGLLPASAVQTVVASGTYQLAPMETLGPSVELLRLPKPGGGSYFVEYRWPSGVFDAQAPAVTGVLVHTQSPDLVDPNPNYNGDSDTALIDMHPGPINPNQWTNAAMTVGQVFDDPLRGISIQNMGQSSAGATLAITMPADTTPPSRPGRLTAVVSGTSVALQWTPASDDFAVASYNVARDGAPLGSTETTGFADSGLTPGATVNYAVTATDAAGNIGPAATMAVTLPDTVAPSVPANVTATVTRDGRVHIAWAAATDNVGVVELPRAARWHGYRAAHRDDVRRRCTQAGHRHHRRLLRRRVRHGRQRERARRGPAAASSAAATAGRVAPQGEAGQEEHARAGHGHPLGRQGDLPSAARPGSLAPLQGQAEQRIHGQRARQARQAGDTLPARRARPREAADASRTLGP